MIITLSAAASPSHGDIYLSCSGSEYTSKGTVSVYDATLDLYVDICKEGFNRGAAAAVCRQLGYVDADIAEPGHGDTPPTYFTDAYTLGYEKSFIWWCLRGVQYCYYNSASMHAA